MILVVCPNLAVDVTLDVPRIARGRVHRARAVRRQAGGKGVNVARALTALGHEALVVGLAGGPEIEPLLAAEGLAVDLVPMKAPSRTCLILLEPDGTATVVNEPGPYVEDDARLLERFRERLPEAEAVALMGSVPPGLPSSLYREMAALAKRLGRFCLVDAAGELLDEALAAGPDLVKPNAAEAEAIVGGALETAEACLDAAAALRERGAEAAVVTRGASGAAFAGPNGVAGLVASGFEPDLRGANPTGAGDAFAAGVLAGRLRGFSLTETLRLAVAVAEASLAEGYGRVRAKDVRPDGVRVVLRRASPSSSSN